jgi:predicted nucleic-acid-binding protein
MLAIDTNLIVRYLTGDQPQQSQKAKALIDSEPVFVCKTVLLEAEWVLLPRRSLILQACRM